MLTAVVFLLFDKHFPTKKRILRKKLTIKWERERVGWTTSVTFNIMTYLAELRVDIILLPTDPLTPPLTEEGLVDVGERCGVFLLTGDFVECFGKILAWFASLLGQPDKLGRETTREPLLILTGRQAL